MAQKKLKLPDIEKHLYMIVVRNLFGTEVYHRIYDEDINYIYDEVRKWVLFFITNFKGMTVADDYNSDRIIVVKNPRFFAEDFIVYIEDTNVAEFKARQRKQRSDANKLFNEIEKKRKS